jgi:hypothetical protein
MVYCFQVKRQPDYTLQVLMAQAGHGGARPGAGRKPKADRKVKRSVTLSAAVDALVLQRQQPHESYSQALERLIRTHALHHETAVPVPPPLAVLLETLSTERQQVATIYRRLGWSRPLFERIVQRERQQLAQLGVRLHVATKDAASGRREQYITVDGVRYSALSRDPPGQ